MNFDLCLFPECYADTFLIETLVKPHGEKYNHQHSCSKVAGKMKEQDFAVGIVDKDKKQLAYLDAFVLIAEAENLFLYRHKDYPTPKHFLIVIGPAVEKWILNACKELEISLAGFDIREEMKESEKIERLTKVTKHQVSLQSAKASLLGPLFHEMRRKGMATPGGAVHTLIHWLKTLRDKNYTVTEEDLSP